MFNCGGGGKAGGGRGGMVPVGYVRRRNCEGGVESYKIKGSKRGRRRPG